MALTIYGSTSCSTLTLFGFGFASSTLTLSTTSTSFMISTMLASIMFVLTTSSFTPFQSMPQHLWNSCLDCIKFDHSTISSTSFGLIVSIMALIEKKVWKVHTPCQENSLSLLMSSLTPSESQGKNPSEMLNTWGHWRFVAYIYIHISVVPSSGNKS